MWDNIQAVRECIKISSKTRSRAQDTRSILAGKRLRPTAEGLGTAALRPVATASHWESSWHVAIDEDLRVIEHVAHVLRDLVHRLSGEIVREPVVKQFLELCDCPHSGHVEATVLLVL